MKEPKVLRILNLEDSPLDAELVQAKLLEGGIACELTRVQTRADFAAALEKLDFDLIVADYTLPSYDGLSALEMARKVCPEVPFILVSGTLGEELAIEIMKTGATDYVLKHRLERLVPAVRRAMREAEERSERRRAEEALRRSEEEYRAMFELAGVGKAQADSATGRFLRVNAKMCEITGYSSEELLRMTFREIMHPDDREENFEFFQRMVHREMPEYRCEKRYVRKDGRTIWVSMNASLIWDEDGRPLHAVATIQDITERKRVDEELRESEERYRRVVEQAADAVFVHDLEGRFVDVNRRACESLGYTCEELLDMSVPDIEMDYEPGSLPKLWEKITSDTPRTLEGTHRRKDGTTFPIEIRVGVFESDGRSLMLALVRDTTERKRTEEALRESEERFRATFDQAAVGVAQVAPDGRWLRVNQKLCDITGYDREELLGMTFQDITHPDELETDLGHIRQLLAGEIETFSMEKRYFRKDGLVIWIYLTVSLVRKPSGDPRYFVSVIEDITERKRAEGALQESEERYRTFIKQSTEGIWRFELEQPLPTNIPEDEQIEHFYRHGFLAECNDAMARMYGFSRAEEIAGTRVGNLLPRSAPENVEFLGTFIRSGYRTTDVESYAIDRHGNAKYFLNNLTGVVKNGFLVRVWGTQRDISERRRVEAALRQSEELYRTVIALAAENIFLVDAKTKRILETNDSLRQSLGYSAEELQRMTLYDIVAQDRESIDRHTRHILEKGRHFVGERNYRRKDGSLVDVEVNASTIPYNGRMVMCVTAHDITERKQAENMLRRSLDSLLALYEAGHVLGSTLESEEVGSRLLRIMQRVSNLSTAIISWPDEHGQLRVWRAVGLEDIPKKIRYTPVVQTALRTVLETGEYQVCRLERSDEGAEPSVGLILPLLIHNRSIGLLEAYGPESLLDSDTVDVLSGMTSQAASSLENARLYGELAERERRLQDLVGKILGAQEEERRLVAYEVHDGLAQVAVAAHQHLQAFSRRYPPATERSRKDLDRVLRLVRQTVSDARKIIANLRPTALDDLGLAATISLEVERLREEGYRVDYDEGLGEERLPETVEIALFRVAQEALTNMRKHAQTRRVRVELRRREYEAYLEVRDYGRGFDPTVTSVGNGPGERVGLAGMRERVGMLGGELEISSQPDVGTSVTVVVPLPTTEKED